MTYMERATEIALTSDLCVQVLLNSDNTDAEFIRCGSDAPYMPTEEFTRRKLRAVGLIGWAGTEARIALKEPLEERVVGAIGVAFAEYLTVFIGGPAGSLEPSYNWETQQYELIPRT